jgi:hypothetical protein
MTEHPITLEEIGRLAFAYDQSAEASMQDLAKLQKALATYRTQQEALQS